ncbi:MAG: hypothetical protein B6245_13765 [Desulfobacteraceae bacterium 4572_88]|nr:MAG: hypothetical protein B6245_13765 [Desulfobacteraceae bacterium 4572_88]
MIKVWQNKSFTGWMLAGIVFFFLITGCSPTKFNRGNFMFSKTSKQKGKTPAYYDFEDVLIPNELKVDRKSSFIYRTAGFTGGVLSLKGRVEVNSLIEFFDNNMLRDNWKPVSSFKSPRTIMLFHKDNRWCVISISEGDFSTRAEIWVAPTITKTEKINKTGKTDKIEEGLLKLDDEIQYQE